MVLLTVLYLMQGVPLGLTSGAMSVSYTSLALLLLLLLLLIISKTCSHTTSDQLPHAVELSAAVQCFTWPAMPFILLQIQTAESCFAYLYSMHRLYLQLFRNVAGRGMCKVISGPLCRPFVLQAKASYTQIGIFSLATYPYSFKLFWSPIVDSIYSRSFGRRKSWVV